MPSSATSSPGELAGELVALNRLAICFVIHARGKFIPPASTYREFHRTHQCIEEFRLHVGVFREGFVIYGYDVVPIISPIEVFAWLREDDTLVAVYLVTSQQSDVLSA